MSHSLQDTRLEIVYKSCYDCTISPLTNVTPICNCFVKSVYRNSLETCNDIGNIYVLSSFTIWNILYPISNILRKHRITITHKLLQKSGVFLLRNVDYFVSSNNYLLLLMSFVVEFLFVTFYVLIKFTKFD